MSPDLRRAAHAALDLILDALAAEQAGEKMKRRRGPVVRPVPELPPDATAAEIEDVERRLKRAGYRKTG